MILLWIGSPPHTWRILKAIYPDASYKRITSTYVENTLQMQEDESLSPGSPPHTWRILIFSLLNHLSIRITSTYVENTKLQYEYDRQRWDHLHIRGEYSISVLCFFGNSGSPPHTWRILFRIDRNKHSIRITSTYVENTLIFLSNQSIFEDHLHIRGEYQNWSKSATLHSGSPPHTWRILYQWPYWCNQSGITSTYVENTLYQS